MGYTTPEGQVQASITLDEFMVAHNMTLTISWDTGATADDTFSLGKVKALYR